MYTHGTSKLNSKWSELNADASGEILKRLDVIDKLNFMCTCRSWFSVCCALKGNVSDQVYNVFIHPSILNLSCSDCYPLDLLTIL